MHAPRRRPRRRGSEFGLHLTGILIGGLALAGLGTGVYFWATAVPPVIRDRTSLCPLDGPHSITVFLLDSSDALPEVGRQEVLTRLMDAALGMPQNGLLEIRRLDPEIVGGKVIFSKCNPGDGSGLDEKTGNPRLARKRWEEGFKEPLARELAGGVRPLASTASPILETLQSIAVKRFTGNIADHLPKSLTVVSDLIEHGPAYSQYQGDLSYERFKRTSFYKRVRTDLHGADVRFEYVQRLTKKPLDSAQHIKFWTDWVQDNHGTMRAAHKLQGAS